MKLIRLLKPKEWRSLQLKHAVQERISCLHLKLAKTESADLLLQVSLTNNWIIKATIGRIIGFD